jgi:hypothetical protein
MKFNGRRLRFQYSLRTLMLITVLVSVLCSALAVKMRRVRQQREAVRAVLELGGSVMWDYQIIGGVGRHEDPSSMFRAKAEPRGPEWVRCLLGNDFFATISGVWLTDNDRLRDADLACLDRFPDLRYLSLGGSKGVTDVGLAHAAKASELEQLWLSGTSVSDAGLVHLRGLKALWHLDLGGTRITDAGIAKLRHLSCLEVLDVPETGIDDAGLAIIAHLTNLERLNLNGTRISDAGLEHLVSLKKLDDLLLRRTAVTEAGILRLKGIPGPLNMRVADFSEDSVRRIGRTLPAFRVDNEVTPPKQEAARPRPPRAAEAPDPFG